MHRCLGVTFKFLFEFSDMHYVKTSFGAIELLTKILYYGCCKQVAESAF